MDLRLLAAMLFAAQGGRSLWLVFIGASLALVLSSAVGVAAGHWVSQMISPRVLGLVAGVGFILVGVWTLVGAWYSTAP